MTPPPVESRASAPVVLHRGRTVGIVSVLTLFVAFVGYLREAVLASRFGSSITMDAYFGAIFIPTMIYMVLIAGTLSPVFIPILLQHDGIEERTKLSETFSVITTFVLLLLVLAITAGVASAHQWLPLLFSGFSASTARASIRLVYIIFPSVLFVALAGILTGVLNGFHKFALAAIAPALSSVTIILAALFARGESVIYTLGIATALGFVLQFLLLLPATASLGIHYRFCWNFRHSAVLRLLRLGVPLFSYLVVANASSFVERNLASQLSAGAVSIITYATRLFAVPSNFLAAPLAIVAYPQFAREALKGNRGDLRSQVSRMFRLIVFLFLPLTIWTVLNALPLTRTFYERGQFRLEDSLVTARVLTFYGIGVLPNAIAVVLLRCFYAIQDTITPLWAETIDLVFYILTARVLTRHFGIAGLAVTRGMTFFVVAAILIFVLSRRKDLLILDFNLMRFGFQAIVASCVMAIVSWATLDLLQSSFDSGGTSLRAGVLCLSLLFSGVAFFGMARLFKLKEASDVLNTAGELLCGSANRTQRVDGQLSFESEKSA